MCLYDIKHVCCTAAVNCEKNPEATKKLSFIYSLPPSFLPLPPSFLLFLPSFPP